MFIVRMEQCAHLFKKDKIVASASARECLICANYCDYSRVAQGSKLPLGNKIEYFYWQNLKLVNRLLSMILYELLAFLINE